MTMRDAKFPATGTAPAAPDRTAHNGSLPHMGVADEEILAITQAVRDSGRWVKPLRNEIGRVIVGQKYLVDRLLVALLANGHVLLEGNPGLAKTLALRTLATAVDTGFRRIQFTPDMLPADILGTEVYRPQDGSFEVKRGPVFSNLILADEINRAPAKVQSALLEAMQEHQVTIGERTFRLDDPFLVLATQNPIEQEGTYPLPEAQVDRFLLKVVVTYPRPDEERMIIDVASGKMPEVDAVVTAEDIVRAREVARGIYVDDKVKDYIVSLVHATRDPDHYGLGLTDHIRHGASPRATLALVASAKAVAFLKGRGYVTPSDVKAIAMDVLRHRIGMTYVAEAEGMDSQDVVKAILDTVPVP